MKLRAPIIACFALLLPLTLYAQFRSSFESPGAAEQFRLGVQAYNMGRYAESILLLEKALAYAPQEALIQSWLGRAYYKNGFDETALRTWQPLLDAPNSSPSLRAKAELLRVSRSIAPPPAEYRYVEVARFEGRKGKETYFMRPSAAIPLSDGSLLVVAHGSNEVVQLDANGIARRRERGGLAGFDRPYGAALGQDGTLFVSELNGDRIARVAPDGSTRLFGSRGRGPGMLLGPQYLASDEAGYLYVVDYGNSRVCKFDPEGTFILSFGSRDPANAFPGFASPSGILAMDGVVFVADTFRKAIYRFDPSGNYLGSLAEGELHSPEGLASWQEGAAIVAADTDRVVSIDLESETVKEVYRATDRNSKIVCAVPDFNGNIALCDFAASAVTLISESSLLVAGYDVEIARVLSSSFPIVELEVQVRDREGRPIVGLRDPNFYVTERYATTSQRDEGGKAVVTSEEILAPTGAELIGLGPARGLGSTTILLERTAGSASSRDAMRATLAELYGIIASDGAPRPSIVTAGPTPALEKGADLAAAQRLALAPGIGRVKFDLGLRLAATSLFPLGGDAVVYLGGGAIDDTSFAGTTLAELASLLKNNGIRFYALTFGEAAAALRFLAERTGGAVYLVSNPRGLSGFRRDYLSASSGSYRLRFTSKADSAFGRRYQTAAVEVYLYKKSGKDELGYYGPLN